MRALVFLLTVSLASQVAADLRLPRLFGDHMILQQKRSNHIWGWAEPGEEITVSTSWGARAQATAATDVPGAGKWRVSLPTPGHRTGQTLTIQGKNRIRINHVAIGEVWLCAVQSNMGWSTGNSFGAEAEADVSLPDLRIYRSAREHWHEPL